VLELSVARRAAAEPVGTAMLLAGIIGSGIMAERLAGGNVALALLANTLATGGVLAAIILAFGPISGAHFNPAVALADALPGGLRRHDVAPYVVARLAGAIAGVAVASRSCHWYLIDQRLSVAMPLPVPSAPCNRQVPSAM
jgi:glycerol uptake facilitator-like aquaporin